MFSIFFKCPACDAHMSAEDEDVGWAFTCPTCNETLSVPSGDIIFSCEACEKKMMAPASMVGEDFSCPECKARIVVPAAEKELSIPETPPEPPKKVITKVAIPPEVRKKLDARNAPPRAGTEKRLNDYLMMTWGPDVLAAATPKDGKKGNRR